MRYRILYLSRNGSASAEFKQKIRDGNAELIETHSSEDAEKELLTREYHLVVDYGETVSREQMEVLSFVRRHKLSVPVIVSAKQSQWDDAVRVMKAGAADFVVGKNPDSALTESIFKTLRGAPTPPPGISVDDSAPISEDEIVLIGQSQAMEEVRSAIALVANSRTAVLISGESGTGKEIVARSIHLGSDRAAKPFLAINCAALPKDVIENELFGHEKGAFTGALAKKAGCFEHANSGTLFFDEIAEMNPDTQAKLLRVIEFKSFRRLGGKEEVQVDVRTLAATNKDVEAALKSGELRQDLYYRFSVIEIHLPPLRERKKDIPLLLDHFLPILKRKYNKSSLRFDDEVMERIVAYNWPGNVRELRNIAERLVVTCPDAVIQVQHLPERLSRLKRRERFVQIPVGASAKEAKKLLIQQTLSSVGNNKSKAAKILGVSRKTLYKQLRRYRDGRQ